MCRIDDRYNIKLSGLCCKCIKRNSSPPHSCEAYPVTNGIPPEIWRGDIKECQHFENKFKEK